MTVAAEFKIEYLQYLDTDGTLVRDDLPASLRDPKVLVPLFKQMLFVRTF
ncbi:pyruvate dehydrogenase (acetyl-transferring) E1 component subunit alpha, partial [Salmonella enterica subsp. enterica serovar Typhimurium]|nr:pyruvate dehydrogenase (acetyl-transferring) E1 component subunit alpha [Salmonella enterica subsp. enterica serovar Typhimurium]